jgi:hypothetical protein
MSAPHTPDAAPAPVPSAPSAPSTPAMLPPMKKRESVWRVADGDIPWPIVDDVVIDDAGAVDGIFSEKQMRLLTEPLYSSWAGPEPGVPFVALANVGLFNLYGEPPIVPDAMLSLEISQPQDITVRANQSYFVWVRGKVPDVVVEIVSNREGGEDTDKLRAYAHIRIPYYVIFDPQNLLRGGVLRVFHLDARRYRSVAEPYFLEGVGLALTLWPGQFEGIAETWLRWCDKEGMPIPTGAEMAVREKERAEKAEGQAEKAEEEKGKSLQDNERLKAKLRAAGIDPDANGP